MQKTIWPNKDTKIFFSMAINPGNTGAKIHNSLFKILKLNKRLSELVKLISSIEAKLSNKQFIDKAPEKVVDGEKNKLNDFIIEREKILSNIEVLK